MEIRQDMLVGFGVLFASAVVVHLILVNAAKGKSEGDESAKTPRKTKINNLFVRAVYPVLIGGFLIAMLWTGYTAKLNQEKPQGELDQKSKPGVMTYEKGENSPEDAGKRLADEDEKGQKESMDDLQKFREERLKKSVRNAKPEEESK